MLDFGFASRKVSFTALWRINGGSWLGAKRLEACVKEQITIDDEQNMTTKLTAIQLDWLKFLLQNGPNAGAGFGNRVKGTCAKRGWAEWDRQGATWSITRIGRLVVRRANAVNHGDVASSSSP
jgi:hypothetical protein